MMDICGQGHFRRHGHQILLQLVAARAAGTQNFDFQSVRVTIFIRPPGKSFELP
jgi:hypothetical protein